MSELFKSKVGMLVAGIYLLMVLFCVLYINLIDGNSPPLLLLMLLVAPWFYLFTYLNYVLGLAPTREVLGSPNVDYRAILDIVLTVLSVLINAFILYLLGYLGTKAYKFLSSGRE
jgi:hypothetical protein